MQERNQDQAHQVPLSLRLKQAFEQWFSAPLAAWEQFAGLCTVVDFKRETIIKPEGEKERFFYFILEGSAGLFLCTPDKRVCLDFAFENQFCGDYMSLLSRQATPLQVMTLEASRMARITAADFYKLGNTQIGAAIMQVSAETSFLDKQQQQLELLTCSAEQRYQILAAKFPGIHNRVAQKHIASYLGITPQSLSRIRAALR